MCKTQWILLLLTTCCFVAAESYIIGLRENQTLARFKRQTGKCSADSFLCNSGECVNEDMICDGAENCKDGSDEGNCTNFPCPKYLFRCQYGACINADHVCDGVKHCKDNSDETKLKCDKTSRISIISSSCGKHQFPCDNGDCIDDDNLCDGTADCKDASDETVKACSSIKCFKYTFTCDYGACINKDLVCNGVNDCHDGSDEKNCPDDLTPTIVKSPGPTVRFPPKTTVQPALPATSAGRCELPPFPSNGKWEIVEIDKNTSYQPGQFVSKYTILEFKCNTDHSVFPITSTAYCNERWSIPPPKCIKTCAPILTTRRMTAKCTLNELSIDCQTPYEGTQAEVECTSLYEEPSSLTKRPYRYCRDGTWDSALPNCVPICGLKGNDVIPHVIGEDYAKYGEYPWMVGIYLEHNKEHICGGFIITPEITLTAAHCFVNSKNPNYYMLAAGKFYRDYNAPQDREAVFSKIKELKIHDQFQNGENWFANDIAIMVVETPFNPSRVIKPVCIDYVNSLDETALENQTGVVTGWGYTTGVGSPSDMLKVLEVNYASDAKCSPPESLRKFHMFAKDKMCATSTMKGKTTCQGDSGGPLIFKSKERYFVRGIVSLGAKDLKTNGCDISTQVLLFTGLHHHASLIQKYDAQNRLGDKIDKLNVL